MSSPIGSSSQINTSSFDDLIDKATKGNIKEQEVEEQLTEHINHLRTHITELGSTRDTLMTIAGISQIHYSRVVENAIDLLQQFIDDDPVTAESANALTTLIKKISEQIKGDRIQHSLPIIQLKFSRIFLAAIELVLLHYEKNGENANPHLSAITTEFKHSLLSAESEFIKVVGTSSNGITSKSTSDPELDFMSQAIKEGIKFVLDDTSNKELVFNTALKALTAIVDLKQENIGDFFQKSLEIYNEISLKIHSGWYKELFTYKSFVRSAIQGNLVGVISIQRAIFEKAKDAKSSKFSLGIVKRKSARLFCKGAILHLKKIVEKTPHKVIQRAALFGCAFGHSSDFKSYYGLAQLTATSELGKNIQRLALKTIESFMEYKVFESEETRDTTVGAYLIHTLSHIPIWKDVAKRHKHLQQHHISILIPLHTPFHGTENTDESKPRRASSLHSSLSIITSSLNRNHGDVSDSSASAISNTPSPRISPKSASILHHSAYMGSFSTHTPLSITPPKSLSPNPNLIEPHTMPLQISLNSPLATTTSFKSNSFSHTTPLPSREKVSITPPASPGHRNVSQSQSLTPSEASSTTSPRFKNRAYSQILSPTARGPSNNQLPTPSSAQPTHPHFHNDNHNSLSKPQSSLDQKLGPIPRSNSNNAIHTLSSTNLSSVAELMNQVQQLKSDIQKRQSINGPLHTVQPPPVPHPISPPPLPHPISPASIPITPPPLPSFHPSLALRQSLTAPTSPPPPLPPMPLHSLSPSKNQRNSVETERKLHTELLNTIPHFALKHVDSKFNH